MEALECVTGDGWSLVGFVFVAVLFFVAGMATSHAWRKRDEAGYQDAAKRVKDFGDKV